ncbi:Sec-independent protein translocase protein TatB [Halomonas elongata]|uniref:Sec-independent protein translocase protein TatB n=1 Tax=Halomonas elongata (strain ATCC 33173 / DSM 2581 / NBRC 15536 / NCIMB 2198 / 1H9) TaxID=768066 RepID=E1V8K4_HALED|nr:Sec-independent protein translocase protein TatB [Halomonas elongata]MBW5799261.1 Sec-independent protein translocase protein TatB [Halomonas elongata]RAW08338.1 twin-arginine translocase subunit TatB [Halomonas elongata]WBF17402.1 Sec-independent protein translocase protein TatB [Halomonas elongata]WPU46240.1 Sec-independent protein translocase protein TatB [Halomonas elongata DSM 2581]WVI71033.1 Sec-independent protein translocase protein TatB [Halomonas elongata]
MFDIGFLELLILGIVGLLVLGPERLPRAVRTVGLWIGRIKRVASDMQREINSQLEAEELRRKLDEQQKKLDEGVDRVKRDVEGLAERDTRATEETSPTRHDSSPEAATEPSPEPADTDRRLGESAPQDADKDATPR